MSWDPDFVITVGGNDITERVAGWTLADVDQAMSSLLIKVENHDGSFSCQNGDKVTIKFGYVGDLSDEVEMDIRKVEEHFSSKAVAYTNITAYDCTWIMNGRNVKGQVNGDPKKAITKLIEDQGFKAKVDKLKNGTIPPHASKDDEKSQRIAVVSQPISDVIMWLADYTQMEA